jgi:hypothetical protein
MLQTHRSWEYLFLILIHPLCEVQAVVVLKVNSECKVDVSNGALLKGDDSNIMLFGKDGKVFYSFEGEYPESHI